MKTTRLIGTEWKCGDVWSGCVLIGRGLFLKEVKRMIGLVRRLPCFVNCLYEVLRAQCSYCFYMNDHRNSTFLDSSMVEHSAVNRVVVGSSPTRGACRDFRRKS